MVGRSVITLPIGAIVLFILLNLFYFYIVYYSCECLVFNIFNLGYRGKKVIRFIIPVLFFHLIMFKQERYTHLEAYISPLLKRFNRPSIFELSERIYDDRELICQPGNCSRENTGEGEGRNTGEGEGRNKNLADNLPLLLRSS